MNKLFRGAGMAQYGEDCHTDLSLSLVFTLIRGLLNILNSNSTRKQWTRKLPRGMSTAISHYYYYYYYYYHHYRYYHYYYVFSRTG